MSGPSLEKLDAHRSIHDAAFFEAKELTELLVQLHSEGKKSPSLEVAKALIESWEQRTLAHAESEEEGFYQKNAKKKGDLTEVITMLKRDHHILRTIVQDVKKHLESQKEVNSLIINHFQALLIVVQIHSREEEKYLLHDG